MARHRTSASCSRHDTEELCGVVGALWVPDKDTKSAVIAELAASVAVEAAGPSVARSPLAASWRIPRTPLLQTTHWNQLQAGLKHHPQSYKPFGQSTHEWDIPRTALLKTTHWKQLQAGLNHHPQSYKPFGQSTHEWEAAAANTQPCSKLCSVMQAYQPY